MKFLKALGIGIATQLSVTILSVILLLAFCSVSPGGASVILSGVVALGVIHTIFMAFVYTHCEKDVAEALSRGTWFPALNYMPFVTMMPALVVIAVTTFITGFYELLDAKIKDRNIPDSTSDTHKGADKNDDSL